MCRFSNTDWVLNGDGTVFFLFRIRGKSNVNFQNTAILMGDAYTSHPNDPASLGTLGAAFVKYEAEGSGDDTVFSFSHGVLNGIGIWDLTGIPSTHYENPRQPNLGERTHSSCHNCQGCTQWIGTRVEYSDVRFNRCSLGGHCGQRGYTAAPFESIPGLVPLSVRTKCAGPFGMPAEVGDLVWKDLDGDGVQDVGEPGVAGVKVKLFDSHDPPRLVASQLTDSTGNYLLKDVPPGNGYRVRFVKSTLPDGCGFTLPKVGGDGSSDSDAGPHGFTRPFDLAPGETRLDVDAGIVELGQVGDRVWKDLDGDGIQDAGEPGVAGVEVQLLDSSGIFVGTQTTDRNGKYLFDGVPPGRNYRVKFEKSNLPAGFQFTLPKVGGDDSSDSDANSQGVTNPFALAPGESKLDVDAGIAELAPPSPSASASPSPFPSASPSPSASASPTPLPSASPSPSPSPSPSYSPDTECELEEGGHVLTTLCEYPNLVMEHCYLCYSPPVGELIHCDGWSEQDIIDQCKSAVPLTTST